METSVNNECKAFTSLEQSKKLAEILPLESADMFYCYGMDIHTKKCGYDTTPTIIDESNESNQIDICDIPCWSLTALYNILPNNEKESTTLSRGGWKIAPPEYIDNWWCEYEDERHTKDFTVSADNPVDACVAMIEKLHELNLL